MTYTVNFSAAPDKAGLHAHFKQALSLPEWYGGNLDALFDCLTDMPAHTVVRMTGVEGLHKLGDWGDALAQVFRDAEAENPGLLLEWTMD